MKIIGTVITLVILCVAAYWFVPGSARQVDAAIGNLEQDELENNWEYYYDQEVLKLEAKLAEFSQQQVETVKRAIQLEREIEGINSSLLRTEELIEDSAEKIRVAKDSGTDMVVLLTKEFSVASATAQLRGWIVERNGHREHVERLGDTLERAKAAREKEAIAKQKGEAMIDALRREKAVMASELEINDIEQRLRALEQVSVAWVEGGGDGDLTKVRAIIQDKLLSEEARDQLAQEEDKIDSQMGLGSALERSDTMGEDTAVDAELDALLGQ